MAEREATEWETYCINCAEIVAIDAEKCPSCGTVDFDPANFLDDSDADPLD